MLALVSVVFAFSACINDLSPSGGWSSPVQDQQFLYFGNRDGYMVRVFADTGLLDTSWRYPASDGVGEIYANPVISDGTVYGVGYSCKGNNCDGKVFAANAETGASAWSGNEFEIETKLIGTPALGDGVLIVGTSTVGHEADPKGYLLALDSTADAGQSQAVQSREKWRLPVDGAVWGGPVVVDNIAYFGTMSGTVYAVDLADRPGYESNVEARVQWTFGVGGAIAGPMLNADGKLYFGSFDDKVYQLDIATRTQQPAGSGLDLATEWSFDTGAWVWAMPLLRDGVLYASTLSGQVYALNQESGTPVWDAPAQLEGEIVARPAVINSNRGPALAVPSSTGDVYVVVIENGQVTGQFGTGGNGVKSSPAAVGDDSLFVHTVNGQLRVYNATSLAQQTCIEPKGGGAQC